MGILSDKDWQLNDDFKLTIVRVKKYTLPDGVSEDDIDIEDGEEEYFEEEV